MIDTIINSYYFNQLYAEKLVEDLSEEQMYESCGKGVENHPAFTLGHLVMASAGTIGVFGLAEDVPDGWAQIFERTGPGDPRIPLTGKNIYPKKSILLKEYIRQHKRLTDALRRCDVSILSRPCSWRFKKYFQTIGDAVFFMCCIHETMHLSQVSSWRRAMGLPSALSKL